ncbi:MAG: hypothetical protein LBS84_02015, partial [Clostridiales bacterium]|nr:hypothetical protein [Clostridiales bacterium]
MEISQAAKNQATETASVRRGSGMRKNALIVRFTTDMNQPQEELAVKNASKKRGKSSKNDNMKMRRLSKKQAVLELQPSES